MNPPLRLTTLVVVVLLGLLFSPVARVYASVDVYDGSTLVSSHPTIQLAVTAASAGNTVVASAGTYAETTVTVNKPLTVKGANTGVDPNTGARGAESQLNGMFVLASVTGGVTIDGFKVAGAGRAFVTGENGPYKGPFSGVTITNNLMVGQSGSSTQVINNGAFLGLTTLGCTDWTITHNRIEGLLGGSNTGARGVMALFRTLVCFDVAPKKHTLTPHIILKTQCPCRCCYFQR